MMIHDINPNLAIIDGYIIIVGVVYDDGWSSDLSDASSMFDDETRDAWMDAFGDEYDD
jgi:hypothetical protein